MTTLDSRSPFASRLRCQPRETCPLLNRRLLAMGLLSVYLAAGCAGGATRGFLARRSKTATTEEEFARRLISDANRLAQNGDVDGAMRLMDHARATTDSTTTAPSRLQPAQAEQSTIAHSDRGATRSVEAPVPSRNPSKAPLELPDDDIPESDSGIRTANFDTSAKTKLELDVSDEPTSPSRQNSQRRSLGGGQFDIPSRGPLGGGFAPIEAPIPKRKPGASANDELNSPNELAFPHDARPLPVPAGPIEPAAEFSADLTNFQTQPLRPDDAVPLPHTNPQASEIVTADFQDHEPNSGVVPAGATQRPADMRRGRMNPWTQFRELTDPNSEPPNRDRPLASMPDNRQSAPLPTINPNTANWPTQAAGSLDNGGYSNWPRTEPSFGGPGDQPAQQTSQPPPWPVAQQPTSNAVAPNQMLSPEPWPRSPAAGGSSQFHTSSFAQAAAPHFPSDIQPVAAAGYATGAAPPNHAEMAGSGLGMNSSGGPTAAVGLSPNANLEAVAPPGNPFAAALPPNGTPTTIAPLSVSPELDQLIAQTTAELAAMTPGDSEIERQLFLRKHVQLRLLFVIAGQIDRALQPVPHIDATEQEFWQQMLWGLANYFDLQGMPDAAERATQTVSQLQAASLRLQEKARLDLHNVAFCHKITSFGNYQRFKRDEFTPGQPVLLYAEVSNFKSEATPDGQFRTLMKSSLDIVQGGPQGRVLDTIPFSPSEDRCRNQRRDYFHSYEFAIPQGISPGPHTLRLTVEDQLGKKTAVTTLSFMVE